MTRETVGKVSLDLLMKNYSNDHSAEEQMREQLKDYEKNVEITFNIGKKKYIGDFYVVVLTKKERIMKNVLRSYYFSRKSCPTPEWDQAVYRFDYKRNDLVFLWVIPSRDTCQNLRNNALETLKSERQLLNFVFAFDEGTLLDIAKGLNKEMDDSPLLA